MNILKRYFAIVVALFVCGAMYLFWAAIPDEHEYWESFSLADAQMWVSKEPNSPDAHAVLGHRWLTAGFPNRAIHEFRSVARLEPQNYTVHEELAQVLERFGRNSEAIIEWKTVSRLIPKNHPLSQIAQSKILHLVN